MPPDEKDERAAAALESWRPAPLDHGAIREAAALEEYRRLLLPLGDAPSTPPTWVLQGFLSPGLTILVGPPRSYKSLLALHMIAAVTEGVPIDQLHPPPQRRGSAIYFPAEQSPHTLRYIYETRVLGHKLPEDVGRRWDFAVARDPWDWKIDEPTLSHNLLSLIEDLKPTLIILDPFIHFHSQDENDPHVVSYLVPLKKAVRAYQGSLLLIHHVRKGQAGSRNEGIPDWERVRGTSALFAMADGGIQLKRLASGGVNIQTDFKDFPGSTWTWNIKK